MPPLLAEVEDVVDIPNCCSSGCMPGGMPLVKNSTAMSGLPFAALKQWRTSASGNPIPVKLLTTSAGNSGAWLAETSDLVVGVDVEIAALVEGEEVSDSEALFSTFEEVFAEELGVGAFASSFDSTAVEGSSGAFAAAFFVLVTITTKKSFCFIPQPARSSEIF